jgi:UDP-glucuronate decarboxylase
MKMQNKKTILVTGGAGFIGANLCRELLKSDANFVIAVDNLYSGKYENIIELLDNDNFRFVEHDIITPLVFSDKIDEIYHLACPASPPFYQKSPIAVSQTCFNGSLNMLELAKMNDAKILLSSTSEIYGEPLEHPQKESYRGNVNPIGIRSCYDEGKRIAESLFFDYYRQFNTQIKIVRIFNTYGPFMRGDDGRVVTNFINQALNNQDITIFGNGTQTRSFCFVDDLIQALIKMMKSPSDFTGPVNLGNPQEVNMLEVAELIIRLTDSNSKLIFKPLPSDDPTRRRPDISLAESRLAWKPTTDLSVGIQKTINFFKF